MTFEDDTTCCKMHKLGVFPFFVTIGDILQHKLYSVITIGVMLRINLKLILVLVLHCNLPSQIVTPLMQRCQFVKEITLSFLFLFSVVNATVETALSSIHHNSLY